MKGIQKTGREKHAPFLYFLIGNLVLFDWRIINKTVEIYYLVDEFLKEYDSVIKSHSLEEGAPKKRRNRKFTMSRVARS